MTREPHHRGISQSSFGSAVSSNQSEANFDSKSMAARSIPRKESPLKTPVRVATPESHYAQSFSAAIEDYASQTSMPTALATNPWYGRGQAGHTAQSSDVTVESEVESEASHVQPLHYHHQRYQDLSDSLKPEIPNQYLERPTSTQSRNSSREERRASASPRLSPYLTDRRTQSRSPDPRPLSYIDLLNTPYPQLPPVGAVQDNAHLREALGNRATLLTPTKTLEMYRANIKKTTDPTVQYEFALLMVTTAQDMMASEGVSIAHLSLSDKSDSGSPVAMIREARQILQHLADRSYPFAQYYLADGFASGMFNKGKEDHDKAFPLFVSASKHGHAEASYRAALCYEYGWGTRRDGAKALRFHREAAAKKHPGAMARMSRACLYGELGQSVKYREGVKWLKRAAESADEQYNSAPYELGFLHQTGYGDDIFQDEAYAAQLFTKSASLGHADANYLLGDAYEHGKLTCPRDAALSVHFYNCAAQENHPEAMMALCAWYMIGAEPVLEQDENEAYEWAKKAAEAGLIKAQYAVGYFTESGIGCRRDVLEANMWYVKAAEQGDERAKHRLAAIRAAAAGGDPHKVAARSPANVVDQETEKAPSKDTGKIGSKEKPTRTKKFGIF